MGATLGVRSDSAGYGGADEEARMHGVDRRTLLFAALGWAAVGCTAPESTGDPEPSTPSPSGPRPSTTPPPPAPTRPAPNPVGTVTMTPDLRPRWPLSGVVVEDEAALRRPAVAVKVPDTRVEHPQAGLNDADLVFVQLDGYPDAQGRSSTRLVPVFHSRMPRSVGPVRSLRPVDVPLLAPMNAVIGSTGAAGWVQNYLNSYRAVLESRQTYLVAKGSGAYSIDQGRVYRAGGRTYFDRAVFCHPGALGARVPRFAAGPPQPYLPFARGAETVSTDAGVPAGRVEVPWKGDSYVMRYDFDAASGVYLRSMPWGPHVLAGGARVTTSNVLVVLAAQSQVKLAAGAGGEEPMHHVIDASGRFLYCRDGRAVGGTWAKAAVDQPFSFTLDDGRPLLMGPGRTYVELPAEGAPLRFA